MSSLKVIIGNKKVIKINEINLSSDCVNDIIEKIKKVEENITINLVTIGGEDVSDFSKKLSEFDLDDGDNVMISDYYNGGNKLSYK